MKRNTAITTGIFASLAVLPILGIGVGRSPDDLVLTLATEQLVLSDGRSALLNGAVDDGFDPSRTEADIDGMPVSIAWNGLGLAVQLPEMPPGSHALRMGTEFMGPVRRQVTIPIVAGPFDPRGSLLRHALELEIAADAIDDRNEATPDDLASALSRFIPSKVGTVPMLGRMRSCPIVIQAGSESSKMAVVGSASFDRGRIDFVVPLRFRLAGPRSVALVRAGQIRTRPDERVLDIGRTSGGSVGSLLLGLLAGPFAAVGGWVLGSEIGEHEAAVQAQTHFERSVDAALRRLSEAMRLPSGWQLGDLGEGVELNLTFAGPPTFGRGGSLVVALDARFQLLANATALPGPLRFDGPEPRRSDGSSHLRVSAPLVAALVDALSTTGQLERTLNRGIAASSGPSGTMLGPLRVDRLRLRLPALVERGDGPSIGWSMADVAIDTNLPRDVRAFVRGGFQATVRTDRRALRAAFELTTIQVSCRGHGAEGWKFFPCLGDETSVVPNLPQRVSEALEPVDLFEELFDRISNIPIDGRLGLSITPEHFELGSATGAPAADLTLRMRLLSL